MMRPGSRRCKNTCICQSPACETSCHLVVARRRRRIASRSSLTHTDDPMMPTMRQRLAASVLVSTCWVANAATFNETPATFNPRVDSFNYVKREVNIAMRDGVKLHTLILIPRGAARAPMLLTRTPYGASNRISVGNSSHLSAFIDSTDVADDAVVNGGYIRVVQ